MNEDYKIEATKDMRVLREAPKFEAMAKKAEWSVNMKDYSMDTLVTIGASRKKYGSHFVIDFDGKQEIVPVAAFNVSIKDIMGGNEFKYRNFRLQRISANTNQNAFDNTMCAASLGNSRAILDIEEMLGYTRLV